MNRKDFIQQTTLATAGVLLSKTSFATSGTTFPIVRIPEAKRKFKSKAVERVIAEVKSKIGNKEIDFIAKKGKFG